MRNQVYILLIPALLFGSNCTLEPFNGGVDTVVTEEDLESATLILGDALSNDMGGITLSVQDAVAIIAGNIPFGKVILPENNTENEKARDFVTNSESYLNEETGAYVIVFDRYTYDGESSERDSLNYIFRDKNGNILRDPQESEILLLESIAFDGYKSGNVRTGEFVETDNYHYFKPVKNTTYKQNSTFLVTGLSKLVAPFPMSGKHTTQGLVEYVDKEKTYLNRYYELSVEFLDIQLYITADECDKAGENADEVTDTINRCGRNIQVDFTGDALFEMRTWADSEKQGNPTVLSGLITYNGDGTAWLNYSGMDERVLIETQREPERSTTREETSATITKTARNR